MAWTSERATGGSPGDEGGGGPNLLSYRLEIRAHLRMSYCVAWWSWYLAHRNLLAARLHPKSISSRRSRSVSRIPSAHSLVTTRAR